ncbi:unnamed protein product [Tilletia laevis]|nr:unnamed protein product [Tilletia laevis]
MGKSFVTPAQPLLSWGVITFTRCHDQDVRAFGDQLSVTLGKLGIKSRPRVYAHAHGRQGGHEDLNEDVPELLADGVSIFALKATGVVDGVFNVWFPRLIGQIQQIPEPAQAHAFFDDAVVSKTAPEEKSAESKAAQSTVTSTTTTTTSVQRAHDLSISALFGDTIYTFGELLLHLQSTRLAL